MPDQNYVFRDLKQGMSRQNPENQCGDVVIKDRLGCWTYQFCVVIDDIDQNINLIIRGQDLFTSVGRQLALRGLISPGAPQLLFFHHDILQDNAGKKLSKRFEAESIHSLMHANWSPEKVIGHAAFIGGLTNVEGSLSVSELSELKCIADIAKTL